MILYDTLLNIHHTIYYIYAILCRRLRVYMWVGRSYTVGACFWAGTGLREGTLL